MLRIEPFGTISIIAELTNQRLSATYFHPILVKFESVLQMGLLGAVETGGDDRYFRFREKYEASRIGMLVAEIEIPQWWRRQPWVQITLAK